MACEAEDDRGKHFFYGTNAPQFPDILNGKVSTLSFLEASKTFIQIYDLLGAAFYIVKKDMNGNVEKLYKIYNKDPQKYKFLDDLINFERKDPSLFAVDALLWLKRALEFSALFIKGVIEDFEICSSYENVDRVAAVAYESSLQKYHGWFVRNVFKVVVKACPPRNEMLSALCYGKPVPEDFPQHVKTFINQLEAITQLISKMYADWGLDNEKTV